MKIKRNDLEEAASKRIIERSQVEPLWRMLAEREGTRPRFDLIHLLYYFGAFLVIGAMGWFMTKAWEDLGGRGIFIVSVIFAALFVTAGTIIWKNQKLRTPAGLLITMAVCLTPLAVYGLQRWLDIWAFEDPGEYRSFHRWIRGGWFPMEIATIAAGIFALRFFKFPFLTAPIAFTLWYISMDLTPILFGSDELVWENRKLVSLWFGLGMIIASYFVDRRSKFDFAFWGYLFGTIAFWGALSLLKSDSEFSKFIYFSINLGLIAASVFLRRRVFVVFGVAGSFGYIGYLASNIFKDSLLFPFALTLTGIAILLFGIFLHKHGANIEQRVDSILPTWMKQLRPIQR